MLTHFHIITLMVSDTAFLTTMVRLTVNANTREARRLTPATQISWVKTFKPRITNAIGVGEGNDKVGRKALKDIELSRYVAL